MKSLAIIDVLIITSLTLSAYGNQLPEYFNICDELNPSLNECILNASAKAIPELVKGVDYLNIPVLSPLRIPQINLDQDDNLNLKLFNVTLKGLETAKLLDVEANLTEKNIWAKVHFDQIRFESTYKVEGRIIILPIRGDGGAKIIFDDVTVNFGFDYDLINKEGEDYMNLDNETLVYDLKHATYRLDNLFNGDKFLGEQTNRFINDNWDTLHQDFEPIISETIKKLIVDILRDVASLVPYNNIFKRSSIDKNI